MEDMLANWKLISLTLNKICPVFSFQINIVTLQFLWVNQKNKPYMTFHWHKKKIGKQQKLQYMLNKQQAIRILLVGTHGKQCVWEWSF